MPTSPAASPMFPSSLDHPSVDWVDVLGHFLEDGDHHQQYNPVIPSHSVGAAAAPIPALVKVAQTPIAPSVTTIKPPLEPSEETNEQEEAKLTTCDKARIRSERKRSREKQRRSDVNTQFGDLTDLLKKIESEDVKHDESTKTFMDSSTSSNNINRVDLICKTISILGRVHNDNRKRRRTIEELSEELKVTKKRADDACSQLQQQQQSQSGVDKNSEPVMMMVPMMVRPDGTTQSTFMPQNMPYYPMCAPSGGDKQSVGVPPSYGAMFNPYMVTKQFSPESLQSSGVQNSNSPVMSKVPNQQQFVSMMQPMGGNGENLAHCA